MTTTQIGTIIKIKLGTGTKDADGFRKALKKADCNIGDWGNDILGKPAFTVAPQETEVELVVVSVAELGFNEGATRADIYKRANELGLDLCPNEVGPQLRLQYKDQPKDEWLLIAMEPITDSDGDLGVFGVRRDGDGAQWLHAYYGLPGSFWLADYRWVFVRRKSFESQTLGTETSDTLTLEARIKALEEWKEHVIKAYNQK